MVLKGTNSELFFPVSAFKGYIFETVYTQNCIIIYHHSNYFSFLLNNHVYLYLSQL